MNPNPHETPDDELDAALGEPGMRRLRPREQGAVDRSDHPLDGRGRVSNLAEYLRIYFEHPAVFRCVGCGGSEWRIHVDMGDTGVALFQCVKERCPMFVPPVRLQVPQMRPHIEKNLGLWIPDGGLP